MADEQKTEETTTTQTDGKVTMEQDKLNELINSKYAKGAEKAKKELLEGLGVESADQLKEIIEAKKAQDEANKSELEKLNEQLEMERKAKDELQRKADDNAKKAKLNALAVEQGINSDMLDYFSFEYEKASKSENFSTEDFVKGMKETKPYVFEKKPPKVDNSSNTENEGKTFQDTVSNITSLKDLEALQRNL